MALPGQSSTLSPSPIRILSGLWSRSPSLLLRNAFQSGLWNRSLVMIVDRFRPHLLVLQMRIFLWFFALFLMGKKLRSAGQVSADLPRHVSSSTPAAQPVSDPWLASLTPSQQAELEEAKALLRKKDEEEEVKRLKEVLQRKRDELVALLEVPPEHRTPDQQSRVQALTREYRASKRKRKKRRKRRTPRTSSLPGRACRRLRQWFACKAGVTGDDVPRVMFPSGVVRPKMLCIKAGMVQKDSCSGMARLVLLVTVHLVLCFFPSLQARDARHHGWYGPEGFVRHVQGLVCWVSTMSLALCSSCFVSGQDVRHHGRHGPQDSVEVHRCSSWTRSFFAVVVLRVVSWSRQCSTLFGGSAVAVHHGRRHSLSMRSGSFPWSCLFRKP